MALTAEEMAKIDEAIRREQNITPEQFESNNKYNAALRLKGQLTNKKKAAMAITSPVPGVTMTQGQKDYVQNSQGSNMASISGSNIFKNSKEIMNGVFSPAQNFTTEYRANGNPALLNGISSLAVNGTNMSVPNAVLQKIQAEAAFNQGRGDVVNSYFGRAGTGQYSSNATTADYLNRLSGNPALQGTGSFNYNAAQQDRRDQLSSDRNQVMRGGLTENRSTSGAITGGSINAYNRIGQEMSGVKSIDPRAAINAEQKKNQLVAEALKRMQQIKATTSNLPIAERVIR